MKRLKTLAFGAAAFAMASVTAFAGGHGDLPAEVKARKAHMALYSFNIGVLAGMAKGEVDYDADAASGAANNLAALSQLNQMAYWTPGTDSESIDGSRALPALWDNIPDAIAKGEAFATATASLAGTAGDGLDALRAGIGAVGDGCSACHKAYRKPNN